MRPCSNMPKSHFDGILGPLLANWGRDKFSIFPLIFPCKNDQDFWFFYISGSNRASGTIYTSKCAEYFTLLTKFWAEDSECSSLENISHRMKAIFLLFWSTSSFSTLLKSQEPIEVQWLLYIKMRRMYHIMIKIFKYNL